MEKIADDSIDAGRLFIASGWADGDFQGRLSFGRSFGRELAERNVIDDARESGP